MEITVATLTIIIVGTLLIVGEALIPGAFLIIPGTTLMIIGIISCVVPDFLYSIDSPILGIVVAILVTLITTKAYQLLAAPSPPTTTVASSLIGKNGTVMAETTSNNLKGKVRVGSEIWSANSDESLEIGTEVIITDAKGVHIKVKKKESNK
ncbi:MAG: NfeD family protein [archaeon]|nr:NfeD family protein [archaeon]